MGVSAEITSIKPGDDLHICPACGYEYGFHTSFIRLNAPKDGKTSAVKSTRDLYRVILICPECGARFDAGWRVSFSDEESHVVLAATFLH
ncbi:hypothetical protein Mboo_2158 [Methanoregula boonei 6A8]|jgi:hypothetical protein|uniref:Uncharacterized protein n=1 Tax=Methanoregula boonei (strain DSM 21154 / JCM 14090 / 6A8) TaxID=456442 RepID=A7IAB1_METB6|nr:hypothetical protein [Methanoregula boonei]ABS56672.1 hypothetical protein Mboo_2158 [Methanoregula boonei 6A8]